MSKPSWQAVVSQLERVQTRTGRQQTGLFSLEGLRLLERALRAQAPLQAVLISERLEQAPTTREQLVLDGLRSARIAPLAIPDAVMARLTNGRSLGELMALVKPPSMPSLATLSQPGALFLTAVSIVDPGNVGALMRTAHASGCAALLTVGVSDVFHPKAVRTSMGSIFKLPTLYFETAVELFAALRENGVESVGTAVQAHNSLPQIRFSSTAKAVLMGNEYWGLPDDIIAQLDIPVTIPMAAGVDSYSVNAAAAIVLYEMGRQRDGGVME